MMQDASSSFWPLDMTAGEVQWFMEELPFAIAQFCHTGQLLYGNRRLRQLWPAIAEALSRSSRSLSLSEVLTILAAHDYLSSLQCDYLASAANAAYTQKRPEILGLTLPNGQTMTITLRRSPQGRVWWLISPNDLPTPADAVPTPLTDPDLQLLEALLCAIPEPIVVKDANFRWVLANPAMTTLTGHPSEWFLGKTDFDIFPPDEAEQCRQFDQRILAGEQDLACEDTLIDADGNPLAIAMTKRLLVDQRGRRFILGLVRDRGRQRLVTTLQATEEQVDALIQVIPDMLFWQRDDGTYDVIKSSSEVDSLRPDLPWRGRNLFETFPQHLAERRMEAIATALRTGAMQEYEQVLDINGKRHYEQVRVVPCREHEVIVLVQDVTGRARLEAELQEKKQFAELALRSLGEGIWDWDCVHNVTIVSARYREILGFDPSTPGTASFEDCMASVHPEDQAMLREALDSHLRDRRPLDLEFRMLHQSGQYIWVRSRGQAIWDEAGNPVRMVGTIEDIGDRKIAEQEVLNTLDYAHELNRLKSRFITMMSHEIRTPLAQIQMAAELLEYGSGVSLEQLEYLQQIEGGIARIVDMIEESSNFRQVTTGATEPQIQVVNVQELCQMLVQQVQQRSSRLIHLHLQNPDCCQDAQLDAEMLRNSLEYVLMNAAQYSERDRPIILTLQGFADHLILTITDEGIGIAPEDLPYLFDFFYRGHNAENIPGAGLGLAIAHYYIGLMGGTIEIDSTLDRGTTVTITLPRFFLTKPDDMTP